MKALADAVDFLVVMDYDMANSHRTGVNLTGVATKANAALPFIKGSVSYYEKVGVPPSKLVLAMPFFGNDFECAPAASQPPGKVCELITTGNDILNWDLTPGACVKSCGDKLPAPPSCLSGQHGFWQYPGCSSCHPPTCKATCTAAQGCKPGPVPAVPTPCNYCADMNRTVCDGAPCCFNVLCKCTHQCMTSKILYDIAMNEPPQPNPGWLWDDWSSTPYFRYSLNRQLHEVRAAVHRYSVAIPDHRRWVTPQHLGTAQHVVTVLAALAGLDRQPGVAHDEVRLREGGECARRRRLVGELLKLQQ